MRTISIILFLCIHTFWGFAQGESTGAKFIQRAETLKKVRNYQAALLEYDNAIQSEPNNHDYWLQKGNVYAILKDNQKAIKCLVKVTELKNDYVDVYLALYNLYQKENDTNNAVKALDNAYKHQPNDNDKMKYKNEIVKVLYKASQFQKAGSHIKDMKVIAPTNPLVLYYEAKYSNLIQNYDQAIRSCEGALSQIDVQDPTKSAKYYYELGYAYHQKKEFGKADGVLAKANYGPFKAKVFEMSPMYYYFLAYAYFKIYEFEKSEEYLDIVTKISPNFPKALDLKVEIAATKSDRTHTIATLRHSANAESDANKKAQKLMELCQIETEAKKYTDALVSIEEVLKILPNTNQALFYKGIIQYKANQHKEALVTLQFLHSRVGNNQEQRAMVEFISGLIYQKQNNAKLAEIAFKKALFGTYKYAAMRRLEEMSNNRQTSSEDLVSE